MTANKQCQCNDCKLYRRYQFNIERVTKIIIYLKTRVTKEDGGVINDILRLNLVFLHSMFEDYLREVVRCRYMHGDDKSWLKEISLPSSGSRKNTKFTVEDLLAEDQSTKISEIIDQAVSNHLSQLSFNKIEDVVTWLKRSGLDASKIGMYNPALIRGMNRRHKIVHEADMESSLDEEPKPNPLDVTDLTSYMSATRSTVHVVMKLMRGEPLLASQHDYFKKYNEDDYSAWIDKGQV